MTSKKRGVFTDEMPLRFGYYKPYEDQAKALAGGVGWHDRQPWSSGPGSVAVDGPWHGPLPIRKTRPSRIPPESDWSPFKQQRRECTPVCRHTADQCPTRPQYSAKTTSPPIPDPEGHRLPRGMRFKGQSVINVMTFDEPSWLDSAPIDAQAKAGYTNFTNDHTALVAAFENGRFQTDDQGRWYREGWGPGDRWPEVDREHRKASPQKPATEDASVPPKPIRDSLAGLRGRECRNRNCPGRVPEHEHGNTQYCSERCRNERENARRRGQVGTVSPGIELSSFIVDGQRIGIDTDDLSFSRLLTNVTFV